MSLTMEYTGTLMVTTCADKSCEMVFAISKRFEAARREDHGTFWCPRGHSNYYPGESDSEKSARLLREARAQRDRANASTLALSDQLGATRRSLAATKGVNTRIKNRVAKGVCPCCNRQFQNLHRHMSGQHPDYATPTE